MESRPLVGGYFLCVAVSANNAVSDAVLALFFAGVVPGTDVILSPDTVLRSAVLMLTLGALLLLRKYFNNHKLRHPRDTTAPVRVVGAVAIKELHHTVSPELHSSKVPHISRTRYILSGGSKILARMHYGAQTGKSFLYRIIMSIKQLCITIYKALRSFAIQVWHYVSSNSILAWRWAAPYLWQFDSWLEERVRLFRASVVRQAHRHAYAKLLLEIGNESKKAISGLQLKTFWLSTKEQLSKLKNKL